MAKVMLACELTVGDEILAHVDFNDPIRRRAIVLRTSPAPHNKVSAEVSALVGGDWKDFGIKFARDYPIISLDSIG
ncbi:dihydrofolate reductase [Pseudomonas phage DRL-P1]|nr:dihydrofolate reductase [Pseudomonas phage DRL-P1]